MLNSRTITALAIIILLQALLLHYIIVLAEPARSVPIEFKSIVPTSLSREFPSTFFTKYLKNYMPPNCSKINVVLFVLKENSTYIISGHITCYYNKKAVYYSVKALLSESLQPISIEVAKTFELTLEQGGHVQDLQALERCTLNLPELYDVIFQLRIYTSTQKPSSVVPLLTSNVSKNVMLVSVLPFEDNKLILMLTKPSNKTYLALYDAEEKEFSTLNEVKVLETHESIEVNESVEMCYKRTSEIEAYNISSYLRNDYGRILLMIVGGVLVAMITYLVVSRSLRV